MSLIQQKTSFPHHFLWIVCLCMLYLLIQVVYLPFAIFSDDDLWLAYHTYQYHHALPYRDFAPYKTVLGYYLLLLPMTLFHGVIMPLVNTKLFVALLNTILFILSARWLTKYFSINSVFVSLVIILFSHVFLSYATEIRVDVLAYWCCLFAVLGLLSGRFVFAGLCLAVAFLISQKALWHIIAIDVGLFVALLSQGRWFTVRSLLVFHLALFVPVAAYIGIWSLLSSMHTVLQSMFYEAYLVAALESYNTYRAAFWQMSLSNNPLFFLLFPITLWSLFVVPRDDTGLAHRRFLFVYALVLTAWVISYKQPFLYNMIVLVPAYFLLYAAFFAWLFQLFNTRAWSFAVSKKILLLFTGFYLSGLLVAISYFSLPLIYLIMGLVPLFLTRYLFCSAHPNVKTITTYTLLAVMLILGLVFPMTRFLGSLKEMNGSYQKDMLFLAHRLTQHEGDYVAGIALFYDKGSAIPGLKHLCLSALEYLYQPNETLRQAMGLSSLYFSKNNADEIIASLKQSSVKFYVDNNRFVQLPDKIKTYLQSEYQHYWGSIYLYAPLYPANQKTISLKFSGTYRIESHTLVKIDEIRTLPGQTITLAAGVHHVKALDDFRLQWVPKNLVYSLQPKHQNDAWEKMLF